MSPWGWTPERSQGIWKYGAAWMKPLAAAVPWLTVALLLMMFFLIGGKLTSAEGVVFELPASEAVESEPTSLVALVMPMPRETLVFFDDARYALGDEVAFAAFGEHLANRMEKAERKSLLVLADRRVAGGELMKIAAVARKGGAERILFAEQKSGGQGE